MRDYTPHSKDDPVTGARGGLTGGEGGSGRTMDDVKSAPGEYSLCCQNTGDDPMHLVLII